MDRGRLEELKNKHWMIFQTEILDTKFIWRELSRGEYNKVLRYYVDDYDREEYICKLCIIEPEGFDFENCAAGIPSSLSQHILKESGFSSEPTGKLKTLMHQYDIEMQNFQNQIGCIIHEAFPILDLEDIEGWSMEKTLWYYSRAKYKLNALRGLELQQEGAGQSQMQGNGVISGDAGDFPELAQQKAFMNGKMAGKKTKK